MAEHHARAVTAARAGRWDDAHGIAQQHDDALSARIHGYLHWVEGDLSNARYWYGRTGMDMPGNRRWAVVVKRSTAPANSKGFHAALEDVEPDSTFIVYPGTDRYPKADGIEVIGLVEMAAVLQGLGGAGAA